MAFSIKGWVISDGNLIETVLMRHNYGNSVCVTTQLGCNIGCSFCASGLQKKKRDLSVEEIVLQVLEIEKISKERVNNVRDVMAEGDDVQVKVLDIDGQGRVKLTMKDID